MPWSTTLMPWRKPQAAREFPTPPKAPSEVSLSAGIDKAPSIREGYVPPRNQPSHTAVADSEHKSPLAPPDQDVFASTLQQKLKKAAKK